MQITRNELDTIVGPADWFAGSVHIDLVATPTPPSRIRGGIVRFAPGARTAWHTHPVGQTIFAFDGVGLCQREGGPVEEVRPGDPRLLRAGREPLARRRPRALPLTDRGRGGR